MSIEINKKRILELGIRVWNSNDRVLTVSPFYEKWPTYINSQHYILTLSLLQKLSLGLLSGSLDPDQMPSYCLI